MACFSPLDAHQLVTGEIVFHARKGMNVRRDLKLPCGQCIGCRLERSRQWAMRAMHESQMHDANSFITLTYNDESLPVNGVLDYRDFQLFMKRLRKQVPKVRFYMCGEYGPLHWRPHFHAIIFGYGFYDRVVYKRMSSGFNIYTSKFLERLWPHGFSSVADVSFESAAYIARYCTKKINGDMAGEHYSRVNVETGEIFVLPAEFSHMSLKPGIGYDWFLKYKADAFPHDYIIVNGQRVKPPKAYDRWLSVIDPDTSEFMELVRYRKRMLADPSDSTYDRLRVRESVTRARLSFKRRTLE